MGKQFQLSDFGNNITSKSGILELTDDLGQALGGRIKPVAVFGGGNPAQIPAVTQIFRQSQQNIMDDEARLASMLGSYDTPKGNDRLLK